LSVERSSPRGAIFLSYASQDADAARRIADALRAAGIEVWFDQSELRGGDAWDQLIRRQIKDCALFVPIISASTDSRLEGYFRLEWKLAEDRSHLMARGKPFIVPVTIDATKEDNAHVPDAFTAVQWTRLPGGAPTPQFLERVRTLLGGEVARTFQRMESVSSAVPTRSKARATGSPRPVRWRWAVLGAVVAIGGTAVFFATRTAKPSSTNSKLQTQNSKSINFASDKSIAVLPFVNQSDDQESTAFFSDGMHEDILTSLANIRDLRVISRTSVMEYRGTTKKIPEIARELGVAYILEGSVRRSGTRVRVTGQLIRAASDDHLWAKNFDRDLSAKDVFDIQAALAIEIAGALQAAILPEAKKLLEHRPTENLAAYEFYLQARTHTPLTRTGAENRERLLREALKADPNFAAAWGELAVVIAQFAFRDFEHSPERIAEGDAAIGRAVRLAPESPEIVRALGNYAYVGYRDYPRATAQFKKLIQLQPNNAAAIYNLGNVQRRQGHWVEALANYRKAVELDPGSKGKAVDLAFFLTLVRRWDEAVALARKNASAHSRDLEVQIILVRYVFAATGSINEADQWLARLDATERELPRVLRERAYWAHVKGDLGESTRLSAESIELEDREFESGGLRHCMFLAAAGDLSGARAIGARALIQVDSRLERQPDNARIMGTRARLKALLGQKDAALRDAQRAIELMPESRDALEGTIHRRTLAVVLAWGGEKEKAVAELARLFQIPALGPGSVHTLRVDPEFFPLRGDARFEALLKDPKNHAPLF
jgi:TolB-like protein/Tfp pilus assembly protein PilF